MGMNPADEPRAGRTGLLPAGRGGRRRAGEPDGRGPARRGTGLRHGIHLRAVERQGGVVAHRRGVRGDHSHADRHRRNQSQHPPPAHHRFVGHHHAPAVEGPLHARHRSWHRRDVQRVRRARGDDRADGGLRAGDAQTVARRGGLQSRRADRQVSGAVPRPGLQRGHPPGDRGVRPADPRARWSRVRRRHPAHLFHSGDVAARREDRQGRRRAGRPQPGRREGVVVFRHGR